MSKQPLKGSLTVSASTRYLAKVRDFVAGHAEAFGFGKQEIADIKLAVDEAFTNIIKHSYKKDAGERVEIKLGYANDTFWVSLYDTGTSYDPSSYIKPDVEKKIKQRKGGGVGVYLIKKLMDEVRYTTTGSTNEIHLVKKR